MAETVCLGLANIHKIFGFGKKNGANNYIKYCKRNINHMGHTETADYIYLAIAVFNSHKDDILHILKY